MASEDINDARGRLEAAARADSYEAATFLALIGIGHALIAIHEVLDNADAETEVFAKIAKAMFKSGSWSDEEEMGDQG